jgi:hypothetical protein
MNWLWISTWISAGVCWIAMTINLRLYLRWQRLDAALLELCVQSLHIQHWPQFRMLAARAPPGYVLRLRLDLVPEHVAEADG